MKRVFKSQGKRSRRRWVFGRLTSSLGVAALVAIVAQLSLTPSFTSAARADSDTAFHLVARMPINSTHLLTYSEGWVLIDPIHRRAYVNETFSDLFFHVYDLDAFENGTLHELGVPIRLHQGNEVSSIGTAPMPAGNSGATPLLTIDPTGNRLLYYAGGIIYEVPTNNYDAQTGHPASGTVHAWSAVPDTEEHVNNGPSTGGNAGAFFASDRAVSPSGMSYDAGDDHGHPPRVYLVGHPVQGGALDGVVMSGWDAGTAQDTGTWQHPQQRLRWSYIPRSCGADNSGSDLGTPVYRSGDWLYTFCQTAGDSSTKGVLRVKLSAKDPTTGGPMPDPTTEEFFGGVPGSNVQVHVDAQTGRTYMSSTSREARNVLVFDASANDGRGAYTGEIALTQTPAATHEGFDPATGRWYFLTADGLWYEDGRLRRVAQAIGPQQSAPDLTSDGAPDVNVADPNPATYQPLAVDPAVPGVRPTRIFVPRRNDPATHRTECRTGEVCFDVFEDSSALPADIPDPNESDFTQNVPEGAGKTGQFDGVTSAYGVRLRVNRGLSTLWPISAPPGGIPNLENPPTNNPPTDPRDYPTDPFYYFAGDCGRTDRQVTIGAIRQTAIHGDLSVRDATAEARPVDPDISQSAINAPDNTQTRHDLTYISGKDDQKRDACAIGLLRTLSHPATGSDQLWDGIGGQTGPTVGWPYPAATCQGDTSDSKSGSANGLLPAAASVTCHATSGQPGVQAATTAQLNPTGFPVSVQSTETSTSLIRAQGQGLVSQARAIVKGISIEGVVDIREMVVTATARSLGFCKSSEALCRQGHDPDGGTANQVDVTRQFFDVSLAGTPVCSDKCDPKQVIDTINTVIAPIGYARAANPESDVTQRRKESTLAVVQKDQVLQDSDAATNNDLSSEFPGLEIVIYRDATQRGRGRWEMQLGGVYAQSKFGVVDALDDSTPPPSFTPDPTEVPPTPPPVPTPSLPVPSHGPKVEGHPGTTAVPDKYIPGVVHKGTSGRAARREVIPGDSSGGPAPIAAPAPAVEGDSALAVTQPSGPISRTVQRTLMGALLLASLWILIYLPVYVARRRQFLKEVMRRW